MMPDRTPAPGLDETDLARIVTHPTCGQCGQAWSLPACGPTHGLIAHERQAIVPALVAALRAAWQKIEGLDTENALLSDDNAWIRNEAARYRAALESVISACDDWSLGPNLDALRHAIKRARAALVEYVAGEAWASEVDSLRVERDRYRAFVERVESAARSDARGWSDWTKIAEEARAALAAPGAGEQAQGHE